MAAPEELGQSNVKTETWYRVRGDRACRTNDRGVGAGDTRACARAGRERASHGGHDPAQAGQRRRPADRRLRRAVAGGAGRGQAGRQCAAWRSWTRPSLELWYLVEAADARRSDTCRGLGAVPLSPGLRRRRGGADRPRQRRRVDAALHPGDGQRPLLLAGPDDDPAADGAHHPGAVCAGHHHGAGHPGAAPGQQLLPVRLRHRPGRVRPGGRHRLVRDLYAVRLSQQHPAVAGADHRAGRLPDRRHPLLDHHRHLPGGDLAGDGDRHGGRRVGAAGDLHRGAGGCRPLWRQPVEASALRDPAHAAAQPAGGADPAHDPGAAGLCRGDCVERRRHRDGAGERGVPAVLRPAQHQRGGCLCRADPAAVDGQRSLLPAHGAHATRRPRA